MNDALNYSDVRDEGRDDEDLTAMALAEIAAEDPSSSNDYRAAARRRYEIDGLIEVEYYATVEDAAGRPGCWVAAWLYISDDEARAEALRAAAEAAGAL